MKIVVSILVHENIDVINDQIRNFLHFNKDALIVLHFSKRLAFDDLLNSFIKNDRVYINPVHLETKWGDLLQPHVENFKFAASILEFDYFVMHSSNDMYFRFGSNEYISIFDAGFNLHFLLQEKSWWWPNEFAWKDNQLHKIMLNLGLSVRVASQVEGSFYKFDIFKQIIDVIDKYINFNYDYGPKRYPREEVYFSTIAQKFVNFDHISRPFVFSEVHCFDRIYWKSIENLNKLKNSFLGKIFPEFLYKKLKNRYFRHAWRDPHSRCSIDMLKKLLESDDEFINKFRYLNDGVISFELYDKNNLFAIKRVPRVMTHPLRLYINSLM